MAGFKMHISTSTAMGVAYGAGAAFYYDVPLPACVLAGGLCSVSGMLPDLDSGPGVPLRESVGFAAAVVPMLLIQRLRHAGLPPNSVWDAPESLVLIGAALYLFIRFGLGKILSKFVVHRGMFHSIPALIIVGELAFLITDHESLGMRMFNAGAVMAGFASHLILDEIWSVDLKRFRLKSSFGTAIKFWGDNMGANFCAYGIMIMLGLLVSQDPAAMEMFNGPPPHEVIANEDDWGFR